MAPPSSPLMQSSVFAAVLGLLSVALSLASCAIQSWYQISGVAVFVDPRFSSQVQIINYNVGLYSECTTFTAGFQSSQCLRWFTDFNNVQNLPSAITRARDGGAASLFFLSLSMIANILLVVVAIMTAFSFGGSPKACGGFSGDDSAPKRKIATIVAGTIACTSGLIGAIVGWASLGEVAQFYFSINAGGGGSSSSFFNLPTRTLTNGPGAILVGFAVIFNFAAFFLALLPFYLTPFKALQTSKNGIPIPPPPPPMPAWAGPSNPLPPPPNPPEQQWKAFNNGEKPYYYNATTGETVWELPVGMQVSSSNPLSNIAV